MSCCDNNEGKKNGCGKGLIIFLLLVSILTNIVTGFYISTGRSLSGGSSANTDAVASAVLDKYLANEYAKSGSKEIYDLLAEAQRLQMEEQIPKIKEFIASKKWGSPAGETTPTVSKILTKDEIMAIKKTAYIEWNKDALITLVEYSDLECPFCIRQYTEGTIKKVREKFGDKVNSTFKNFRGVPHENAEIEASASLCAGDIGGTEKYAAYYGAIMARSKGGNGTGFSKDALLPLAKELKLDTKKFQSCLDSKVNVARFDSETAEGVKLGVQGTPGTVIINNETGAYELIAWAYPVAEFERVINKLLAK